MLVQIRNRHIIDIIVVNFTAENIPSVRMKISIVVKSPSFAVLLSMTKLQLKAKIKFIDHKTMEHEVNSITDQYLLPKGI